MASITQILISSLTATSAYMSKLVKDAVWDLDLPVPNWKFVLIAVEHDADVYGFSPTSIERLNNLTGLPDSVIFNSLAVLKSHNILLERSNGGQDGLQINLGDSASDSVKSSQIVS